MTERGRPPSYWRLNGAPGGAAAYVTGRARPGTPIPSEDLGPGILARRRTPALGPSKGSRTRPLAPPGAPSPHGGTEKGKRRSRSVAKQPDDDAWLFDI